MKWNCFKVKMKFKTSMQWRQPYDSDKSDWFAQVLLVKITNGIWNANYYFKLLPSLIIGELNQDSCILTGTR